MLEGEQATVEVATAGTPDPLASTVGVNRLEVNRPLSVVILGGGAWGTALVRLAQQNRRSRVRQWSRRSGQALSEVLTGADVVISAVSMAGVVATIDRLRAGAILPAGAIVATATKGLDPLSQRTPSQLWSEALREIAPPALGSGVSQHPLVVLSGPNLSEEILRGLPAATVVASTDRPAAETVQRALASEVLRVYVNEDPLGTELGGTLKNVMAIAAGVCDGLNLGTNAKAALLTRALPEMVRVGLALGARSSATFFGLAGLGDLLATCHSSLSRNYRVGLGLARGGTLEQVLAELGSTAEGVNTTQVLLAIAGDRQLAVPIAREVGRLLAGEITPQAAVRALIERDLKGEFEEALGSRPEI